MMSLRPEASRPHAFEWPLALLVVILGAAASIWLFFPGIATHDVIAVYDQAYAGVFGDWQPPLLGWGWKQLEPWIGYGPSALFLPTVAIYWAAMLIVFVALRRSSALAWLVLIIAFLPPLTAILGVLWRDVMFAACWLLAFGLVLLARDAHALVRIVAFLVALALFMVGFLIRPNALFAAAPLLVYLAWPRRFSWKRLILVGVPAIVVLQLASNFVNYTWLQAKRENAIHSVFVFDLTGITHFADRNVFPIDDWTPEQIEKVKTICYEPTYWDAIWWPDCSFAMARINRDEPKGTKLFGSETLQRAWLRAIMSHPVAYVQHRYAYFEALMTARMMVVFNQSASGQHRFFFVRSSYFSVFENGMAWLNENTPTFRGLPWLILTGLVFLLSLRWRDGGLKAATLSLSISGLVYTLTYFVFGVAAEYRYVYWTAMTGLVGLCLVAVYWAEQRRKPINSL